jgi:hypothetical protein
VVRLLVHVYRFEWMSAALLVFLLAAVAWLAVAVPAAITVNGLARRDRRSR